MEDGPQHRRIWNLPPNQWPFALRCLLYLLGFFVLVPLTVVITFIFLVIVIPLGAADSISREMRLRRFYRAKKRLLKWSEVTRLLSLGKGTLIVEAYLLRRPDNLWWVQRDLSAEHPDLPLASVSILRPPGCTEEIFNKLTDNASESWWNSHLEQFREDVYFVQMPLAIWRNRDQLFRLPRAYVVDQGWTSTLYPWHPNVRPRRPGVG